MYKRLLFFVSLLLACYAMTASAMDRKLIDDSLLNGAATVSEVTEKITTTLQQQGFTIIGVIDHAKNAEEVGLELPPNQLIMFSNTLQEGALIRRSQTVAIDLPQKILVWEDNLHNKHISYNPPGYLADRHDLPLHDYPLAIMSKTLTQFAELENGLVTVDSAQSVENTIEILKGVLGNLGFSIPFVLNFTEPARHRGPNIRPTQLIIFGNPNVGTQLMLSQPEMGLDLPLKLLVWEDAQHKVHISYNDIKFLAKRHNIQGLDQLLGNVANALANIANSGSAQ